jgi:hypothetical protein
LKAQYISDSTGFLWQLQSHVNFAQFFYCFITSEFHVTFCCKFCGNPLTIHFCVVGITEKQKIKRRYWYLNCE